jgi:predicted N-acetyltransferase YhbS
MMNLRMRKALDSDQQAIADTTFAAFGHTEGQEIADLVTGLSGDPTAQPLLSLVATADDNVVGHILFTNTRIAHAQQTEKIRSAILAPLSVHPEYQSQGIGGGLIKAGLKALAAAGVELVFVLGHPGYYSRFGFTPAGVEGLEAPYPIPPEHADAWMVQELRPGMIERTSGTVLCADMLNDPRHWQE